MRDRFKFFLLLFSGFLDFVGVGLVFPLFAALLFDRSGLLLAPETSDLVRGIWMGVLIALTPLVQFFASPMLGSLSDQKGRKGIILFGFFLGLMGYLFAALGVKMGSLTFLLLYRALFGVSSATMTVIQASIVDISTPENKARHFGLYNMALGTGFTFGPFLGGILSDSSLVSWFNYTTPFLFGAMVTGLNFLLLSWKFKETHVVEERQKLDVFRGIRQVKEAFSHPTLRIVFLGIFLFLFGWDYFFEFSPIFLKRSFGFSTSQIGTLFAYKGLWYAFSAGLLIRPFVRRFSSEKLLLFGMFAAGISLWGILLIKNPSVLWLYLPPLNFFIALFFPVASTYISNRSSEDTQGEILGVYHSVQALALILSPLFSGSLVAKHIAMPIYLGGVLMLAGGGVFGRAVWKSKRLHRLDERGESPPI